MSKVDIYEKIKLVDVNIEFILVYIVKIVGIVFREVLLNVYGLD